MASRAPGESPVHPDASKDIGTDDDGAKTTDDNGLPEQLTLVALGTPLRDSDCKEFPEQFKVVNPLDITDN